LNKKKIQVSYKKKCNNSFFVSLRSNFWYCFKKIEKIILFVITLHVIHLTYRILSSTINKSKRK